MDLSNYKLIPWKEYNLSDNGKYAPIGSKPIFFTMKHYYQSDINLLHPYAIGFVLHDLMKNDDKVLMSKVHISDLYIKT